MQFMSHVDSSVLFFQRLLFRISFNLDFISSCHIIYFPSHLLLFEWWVILFCLIFSIILSITAFESLLFSTKSLRIWTEIESHSSSYHNLVCLISAFSSVLKKDALTFWYSSRCHFLRFLFINWLGIESLGPWLKKSGFSGQLPHRCWKCLFQWLFSPRLVSLWVTRPLLIRVTANPLWLFVSIEIDVIFPSYLRFVLDLQGVTFFKIPALRRLSTKVNMLVRPIK